MFTIHAVYIVLIAAGAAVCQSEERKVSGATELSAAQDVSLSNSYTSLVNVENKTKYISVAVVTDHHFFIKHGRDPQRVAQRIRDIMQTIDRVYTPYNIRVPMTYLDMWTDVPSFNVSDRMYHNLHAFGTYNRDVLINQQDGKHDVALFLTGAASGDSIAGLAYIGMLCVSQAHAVVRDWHQNPQVVGSSAAHEIGHLFGMHDDSNSCQCSSGPCLMSPVAAWNPVKSLSSCSVGLIKSRCAYGKCLCLLDAPTTLPGGPICGNGFHEPGEECDCGSESMCDNKCCDARTCRLKPAAKCANGECCNTSTCQLKPTNTVCRSSAGECDIAEVCTGKASKCPENMYKSNYQSCANGQSYCQSGLCSETYKDQCKSLWGQNAKESALQCTKKINRWGNEWGHCGLEDGKYIACNKKDTRCGKLLCAPTRYPFPNFMIIGWGRKSQGFWEGSNYCRSGITNLGQDAPDPTLAADGTKCGDGKVCQQHRCKDVSGLLSSCHNRCKMGGVCTNKNVCHCPAGRACPDCMKPDSSNTHGKQCAPFTDNSKKGECTFPFVYKNEKYYECTTAGNHKGDTRPWCSLKQDDKGVHVLGQWKFCNTKEENKLTCKNGMVVRKKGCYRLMGGTSLNKMQLYRRNQIVWEKFPPFLESLVCDCAKMAKKGGKKVIGVQFFGECYTTNTLQQLKDLQPSKAVDCSNEKYQRCSSFDSMCTGRQETTVAYVIE